MNYENKIRNTGSQGLKSKSRKKLFVKTQLIL